MDNTTRGGSRLDKDHQIPLLFVRGERMRQSMSQQGLHDKYPPCSKAVYKFQFCSPLPVMVTPPYVLYVKQRTTKQYIDFITSIYLIQATTPKT
jgi:hypothetical protein